MEKKLVLVDMDDTLADLSESWIRVYNNYYKEIYGEIKIEEWIQFNLEQIYPEDKFKALISILDVPDLFYDLNPLEGAIEGLNIIKDSGLDIHFATYVMNGATYVMRDKLRWLHKYFNWVVDEDVTFTSRKYLLKADFLIDDRASNLYKFVTNHPGSSGIGLIRPWNQRNVKTQNDNIELVDSWSEIPNLILGAC